MWQAAAAVAAAAVLWPAGQPRAAQIPRQARLTIADFEDGAAGWKGGVIDTGVARSGRASLRWADHPNHPRLVCTTLPRDWSGFEYLEFWLCSATANGAPIMLIVRSENPATDGPDYWSKRIAVDWTGWKRFRLRLKDLPAARRPLGWNRVGAIELTATGLGCTPRPDTELWLDDVALVNPPLALKITGWQREGENAAVASLALSALTDEPVQAAVEASYAPGLALRVAPRGVTLAPTETRRATVQVRWEADADELWRVMRQRVKLLARDAATGEIVAEASFPAIRAYLATVQTEHRPRVLARKANFEALRSKIRSQRWARELWRQVEQRADNYAQQLLSKGPTRAEAQDIETGRRLMYAAYLLAFAYRISGDASYARAAAKAIETALGWENWVYAFHRPAIYDLGTAACLRYFGTAYEWIADALGARQRQRLAEGLFRRGLRPYLTSVARKIWWSRAVRSNWLAVCCSGAAIGAAALLDEEPRAADIIADAYERVCRLLDEGGRDGGWPEGVGYWGYGIGHAALLAELLYQLSGGQLDLFAHPYLRATAAFGLYMSVGRDGCVNFADCRYRWPDPALMLLLGVRTGNPWAVWYFRQRPDYKPETALIYDEALRGAPPSDLPTSRHFRGIDWVVLRTGFDPNAVVVGLRGGDNGENHGMLEAGNFIVSFGPARLVVDYGPPRYTHEYFSPRRWQFYRANTHGNNCLLIDDRDQLPGQTARARTKVLYTTRDFDFVRMDLTAAYGRDARLVERSVAFIKPDVIVMLDRAQTAGAHRFTWRMHPAADFTLSDGEVVARARGRWLSAGFASSAAASLRAGKHQMGEPYVDVTTRQRSRSFVLMSVLCVGEGARPAEIDVRLVPARNAVAVAGRLGDRRLALAMAVGRGPMAVASVGEGWPGFVSDAEAAGVVVEGGRLARVVQAGGTFVRTEGSIGLPQASQHRNRRPMQLFYLLKPTPARL